MSLNTLPAVLKPFISKLPRTISGKLLQVFLEIERKRREEKETLNVIDVYYFEIMLKITQKSVGTFVKIEEFKIA